MTPLETDEIIDQDKIGTPPSSLEPVSTSFLQVDGSGVAVENWKAAEDGNGSVLRLLEASGMESKAVLRFPLFRLNGVWLSSTMEEDLSEIPVKNSSLEVTLNRTRLPRCEFTHSFRMGNPKGRALRPDALFRDQEKDSSECRIACEFARPNPRFFRGYRFSRDL